MFSFFDIPQGTLIFIKINTNKNGLSLAQEYKLLKMKHESGAIN